MKFPRHRASLHLTHNDHLSCYETVQQYIDEGSHGYNAECWISEEQKQKAIETNDCWFLQWYPDTPVGSCILAAADLDVLLEAASQTEDA
jgi:hypothetical protein